MKILFALAFSMSSLVLHAQSRILIDAACKIDCQVVRGVTGTTIVGTYTIYVDHIGKTREELVPTKCTRQNADQRFANIPNLVFRTANETCLYFKH